MVAPVQNEEMQDEDFTLVSQAQDGSEEAVTVLIRRHKNRITWLVRRFRLPGYDIDDVVQIALIAFLNAIQSFRPAGMYFRTYADLLIRRKLISKARDLRKNRKMSSLSQLQEDEDQWGAQGALSTQTTFAAETDPERVLLQHETLAAIEQAMTTCLLEVERFVLLERANGKTYSEIATCLDLTVTTVNNVLYRARTKMRDALGDELLEGVL